MAFQTEIVTAGFAVVTAVKAAVAKHAAILCDTFIAILTMEIFCCGTVNIHITYIAPKIAFAAGLVTMRTRGHVGKAGAAVVTVAF